MESSQAKKEENFRKAILETIAFFDLFDYPVTPNEVFRYNFLGHASTPKVAKSRQVELLEVMEILEKGQMKSLIENKNGFYFLKGRDEIIKTRLSRYNYTDQKLKRALWVTRVFKLVPWIKMIAVGNIIGAHNLKKEGDIDLFIITVKNRAWLSRFFCVAIIKILNLRPKEGDVKDKICLSFYVSEDNLDLRDLRLVQKGTKFPVGNLVPDGDIYFSYWLAGLVPIYDAENTYDKFIKANSWLKEVFPNWKPQVVSRRRDAGRPWLKLYYYILDFIFGRAEGIMQKFQVKILPDNLKSLMNKDSRVAANDKVIKLHANDRRREYGEKFYEKVKKLNLLN